MRLHLVNLSERIDPRALAQEALERAQERNVIAPHVRFKTSTVHRSSIAPVALELQLEALERDRGRRFGNTGSYGRRNPYTPGEEVYAPTFDEWGFLLAELYDVVPDMHVGSPTYPEYENIDDFHDKTGRTYLRGYPKMILRRSDKFPYRLGKDQVGRRGYGRLHAYDFRKRWAIFAPRDPEWLEAFQEGEVF